MGRRNLSDTQKSYLRGKRYETEKKVVSNPEGVGGKSHKIVKDRDDTQQTTATKIANRTGVSEPTIKRDAAFARAIDEIRETEPEFVQKVLEDESLIYIEHA